MRIGRIIASLACLSILGACGSASDVADRRAEDDPLAAITLAADKTSAVGSARVAMDMTMTSSEGDITTSGEGVFDLDARRGEMTMNVVGPGNPGGMAMEGVFDGTTIYMKFPPEIASQMPGGKPWLSMDLQAVGEQEGLDFNALMQSGSSDPTQTLHYLRGAAGDIETVGEEEIRGTTTTHYKATIDYDKVAEQAPADVRDGMERNVEVIKEWLGDDSAPIEVWIDEDGLARRMEMSLEYAAGPAAGTELSMSMDLFDFGVEADIQVPPPSQVTDYAALMEKMQGQAP